MCSAAVLAACASPAPRDGAANVAEFESLGAPASLADTDFVCDRAHLLQIDRDNGAVTVGRGDATIRLTPVPGAHGRFSAEGRELELREVDADYRVEGGGQWHCVTARVWRGWEEARAEGTMLLGRGNEPGWRLSLGADGGSAWVTDYGAREHRFELADATAGRDMYRWELDTRTDDGDRLAIAIERRECIEDMAGQRYPLQVIVTHDERSYRGCGLWLD